MSDRQKKHVVKRKDSKHTEMLGYVTVISNRLISRSLAEEIAEYYFGVNTITLGYTDDTMYIDWSFQGKRRVIKFNYCSCCLTPLSYGKHFDCEIHDVIEA